MQRLLTGLQPSGALHIGNYFGALKPFIDIYKDYDSFLFVPDYHALTSLREPAALRQNIQNAVRDYLAAGVDPAKVTLYKQSDISEHTELAWIFDCLVTVPFLMQGHAYKDKIAKGVEPNAGLLTYPMLMAADILLYDTDIVPVGEDQRQHIEYAREAAAKFNSAYGTTFKEPKEMILKGVGVVPGTDGQKMSKSYKNTIPLFGSRDEIAKAVMSIVTDSGVEQVPPTGEAEIVGVSLATNVFKIHQLFRPSAELIPLYNKNQNNYKALKEALIKDIDAFIAPMRERREAITDENVKRILKEGAEKARALASAKMKDVRQKVGVTV